ncbi:MAG: dUTP diphosphatase [Alphaproteobacteria bacterium]|nr:dUTP diphosphatase [Alphaproteobacteria bacterium]
MTTKIDVRVQRLAHGADLPLPAYGSVEAAGCDLLAAIEETKILAPGDSAIIPTGLKIALPPGYEAQVRPRSGLAAKFGVTVLNTPGTVDSDYRGEVGVILINHGQSDFAIERGMRIAQMVIAPVVTLIWNETQDLDETQRGDGGFGSTGIR